VRGVSRVGAASGLLGGFVLVFHLCAIAEIAAAPTAEAGIRSDTWTPLSGIASLVLGRDAVHGSLHVGEVVLGLAILLAYAALIGVGGVWFIHACLGTRGPVGLALALGIAYGLFAEVVVVQLVVNPLQDPNSLYESLPSWAWWAGHGVYGAALGIFSSPRLARVAVA
jgi:hypothetical protein